MAGSVNKVILLGNLGRDPEVRTTQDGGKVATLSVATSDSWKDKTTGERRERTEWHRVVIFGTLAEIAERYLHKGSKVYLHGSLKTRKWQDQTGMERYTTEVVLQNFGGELVMLDPRRGTDAPPAQSPDDYGRNSGTTPADPGPDGAGLPDLDDDIPL